MNFKELILNHTDQWPLDGILEYFRQKLFDELQTPRAMYVRLSISLLFVMKYT